MNTDTDMTTTTERITEKIKLWGIVQGVGFRPFVAKCADRYGMKGEVLNIGGLVDIIVTDTPERIDAFIEAIRREKPVPAEIVHMKRERLELREFDRFTIRKSSEGDDEAAMIPADLSICPDCLRELTDPENPRYRHPFISCMVCGPRYTVIDRIPYDRENTAMIDWPMCGFCEGEYTHREDRRYHAQTISCHECGPQLLLRENGGETQKKEERYRGCSAEERRKENDILIRHVCGLLREGSVVAVKGVGGYNLVADPLNPQAAASLRRIKEREQKPFAVMFRNVEEVRKFCFVTEEEEALLVSSAKPILLLEHRSPEDIQKAAGPCDTSEIERSRFIGSFLPSMAFQYLLLEEYGGPLIVTSANLSDMPMILEEEEMFALMDKQPLIRACLYHERAIRVRVDDSVVRVIDGQPQMIRRSKGYAPVPLFLAASDGGEPEASIFAAGGQLKNSFALSKGAFSYVSQYFGDLDSEENQRIYRENVERMEDLFRIRPQAVVCDLHPRYFSTAFAERYARERGGLPLFRVQHHHAHIASVMAEHHLEETVIGVSMDGTGYGTDGSIWGGEFLVCRGGEFLRAAHLAPIRMIGGDGSMKEAWKSAMCYLEARDAEGKVQAADAPRPEGSTDLREEAWERHGHAASIAMDLSEIFDYAERQRTICDRSELALVRAALRNEVNTIRSSSMGRMFDAAAALLGIQDRNDYEGQCAILLEDAAARALRNPGGSERDDLALLFHERTARMISEVCCRIRDGNIPGLEREEQSGYGVRTAVLSGGVFQNKILMEKTLRLLREEGFTVYYNVSVSPNDGGIALGQNYAAHCRMRTLLERAENERKK